MLLKGIITLCFFPSLFMSAVWMYGFTDSPRKEASGSLVCVDSLSAACVLRCAPYFSCILSSFSVYFFSRLSFVLLRMQHLLRLNVCGFLHVECLHLDLFPTSFVLLRQRSRLKKLKLMSKHIF